MIDSISSYRGGAATKSFRRRRGLKLKMAPENNIRANGLAVLLEELEGLRSRVAAALVLANLKPADFLTVQEIQLRCAVVFKLHPSHMLMRSRCAENIADGRMVAMALSREFTGLSLADIGQEFGGRDHGTVLHAVGRVAELCETNRRIRDRVKMLREFFAEKLKMED